MMHDKRKCPLNTHLDKKNRGMVPLCAECFGHSNVRDALEWILEAHRLRPPNERAGLALEMAQHAAMALDRDPPRP